MFRRQVYPKQLTPLFSSEISLEIIFFLVFFELVLSIEHMTVRPQHSKAGSYLKTCQLHCVGPNMYISDSNCLSLISEKPMDKCNRQHFLTISYLPLGGGQRLEDARTILCMLPCFVHGWTDEQTNWPTQEQKNTNDQYAR